MERAVWQSVIGEIEISVPKSSFESIFKKISLISINGNEVKIAVPNVFIQSFLQKKFNHLIINTFEKNGVKNPHVSYEINFDTTKQTSLRSQIAKKDEIYKMRESAPAPIQTTAPTATMTATSSYNQPTKTGTGLNPRYTFDNFIVGSSNNFAYTAAQAIAQNPGTKYNPLFLYSGVGLGKTHLMQAIGNEIIKNNPKARVLYVTIETFVKEFLESIRFKKDDFSARYRNVDVLIVDDMQFITGKEKTQEEFFHTFNALHQKNKQIIISSDQPPKSIPTLTERLRSRFEWGMTIDIQMPDFETRCAIVDAKANLSGVSLETNVIEHIANNFRTNIRELEGALNQLLAYAEMQGMTPSIEMADALLSNVKTSRPQHLTAKQVISKTAKHFQIETEEICSSKRSKHIVIPRQIAMYLLRSELHMSFPKIAKELGRKDHTTAIHSIEKIEKDSKLNPAIRDNIASIRESLYN